MDGQEPGLEPYVINLYVEESQPLPESEQETSAVASVFCQDGGAPVTETVGALLSTVNVWSVPSS